jgi:hypothetical protein
MTAQDTILRACSHSPKPCEVNMLDGTTLAVCGECWNQSVYARRAERKTQLAEHWSKFAGEQEAAMRDAGASIGQRVQYFCPSMLGAYFGGLTLTGRIARNRNGVAIVKLDRPYNGQHSAAWHKGWKTIL